MTTRHPLRATSRAGRWLTAGILMLVALLPAQPASAQSGQVLEYYHLDALGSLRAVTNQNGDVIARHDFLPFGEEYPGPQVTARERKLFTGKERDAETGLDYFGARYYEARIGRFTTVDPVTNLEGSLVDPRKWNRYAYVLNNPLRYIDKDGREEDGAYALYLIREQVRRLGGDAAVAQMDRRNAIMGLSIAGGLAAGALAAEAAPPMMALGQRLLGWLGDKLERAEPALAGPSGRMSQAQLDAATRSGQETVGMVTRLMSAPEAGRSLSAAAGEGATALANAARTGGTLFSAQIPKALVSELQRIGLVQVSQTMMNGVKAMEYRFMPQAAEYVAPYFKPQ